MTVTETLSTAVNALAAVCDGAASRDDRGFDGGDSPFGRRMAAMPPAWWTPAQSRAVWEMLVKYRVQLARYGIDYDSLPEPPEVDHAEELTQARRDAYAFERRAREGHTAKSVRRIEYEAGDVFGIYFPYDPAEVAAVRDLPGRRFVTNPEKHWTVPRTPPAVHGLHRFIGARPGFVVTEAAREAMRPLLAVPAPATPAPAAVPARPSIAYDPEEGFILSFEWDQALINAVRDLPSRRFDAERKLWIAPAEPSNCGPLSELVERFRLDCEMAAETMLRRLTREVEERLAASTAEAAELHVEGLGGTLRPFQAAGVAYLARVKRGFCADDMGLGKTIQALATIQYLDAYPTIIVVPASLKLNWAREARKWLPGRRIGVLDSKTPLSHLKALELLIVSYDILKCHPDEAHPRTMIPHELLARLMEIEYKSVVLDESHRVKTPKARRTRACRLLAEKVPVRMLLSGTPLENRPKELVSQLQILGRLNDFGGYKTFIHRYCNAYNDGYRVNSEGESNLPELNRELRSVCMVRRRKADVLKELPPKVRATIPLEIDNRAEYEQAERDLIAWLLATIKDEETRDQKVMAALRAEQLVRIGALRRLAARGKMAAAKRWVEEFMENDEKLVIFGHHRDIVEQVAQTFSCPSITGDTPIVRRDDYVTAFQTDPETRMIALNIRAGGVGLTLTAASNVAFLEYGWHAAEMDQAEDRCHRIGQEDSVTSWWLVAENTIDEKSCDLIEAKRETMHLTLDGEFDPGSNRASILGDLVKHLRKKGGA
jgi:SWI/SNF-related matrix-associated actin-dependent regulator of chromatin subfamily A-like protein 1